MTYHSVDCCDFAPAERISLPQSTSLRSVINRLTTDLRNRWALHAQRRTDRAAFRHMLTLDDEILDDIGVTRANVEWASQLPLEMSASAELEKTARRARPKIRP